MINKEFVLGAIDDLVADFLYYDRKHDKEFPLGEIERLIENGEITIDEMVNKFKERLIKDLR
jgi:hypothetical protein